MTDEQIDALIGAIELSASDVAELTERLQRAVALLRRCVPIIEQDARMMADITRHAPLPAKSQAIHDSTEYDSERLAIEIPAFLAAHQEPKP